MLLFSSITIRKATLMLGGFLLVFGAASAEAQKLKKFRDKTAKVLRKAADKIESAVDGDADKAVEKAEEAADEAEASVTQKKNAVEAKAASATGSGCVVHDTQCFRDARKKGITAKDPVILYYDGTPVVDASGARPFSSIAPLTVEAPSPLFDSLYLPTVSDGIVRVGRQDDLGSANRRITNTLSNPNELRRINRDRDRSLTSWAMLVHAHHSPDAYKVADRENLPEIGPFAKAGTGAPEYWSVVHLSYQLASDEAARRFFCVVPKRCNKRPPHFYSKTPSVRTYFGGLGADEFQKRAAYQDFMKAGYDSMRAWAKTVGERFDTAAFVKYVDFEEYDFKRGGFPIDLRLDTFQLSSVVFHFVPDQDFERELVIETTDEVKRMAATGLIAMSPDEAQAFKARIEERGGPNSRRIYWVVRVTIDGRYEDKRGHSQNWLEFSLESPTVELFEDIGLRVPIAKMSLASDFELKSFRSIH